MRPDLTDAQYEYARYLATPGWETLRQIVLRRDDYRCTRCPSTSHLHVHHITYARKFHELPEDLATLCDNCHAKQHGFAESRRRQHERLMDEWDEIPPPTPEEQKARQAAVQARFEAERAEKRRLLRERGDRHRAAMAEWQRAEDAKQAIEDEKDRLATEALLKRIREREG